MGANCKGAKLAKTVFATAEKAADAAATRRIASTCESRRRQLIQYGRGGWFDGRPFKSHVFEKVRQKSKDHIQYKFKL